MTKDQQEWVDRFLRIFPRGFTDPRYIGDSQSGERYYKWAAHERWESSLNQSEFERLLTAADFAEVVHRALRVEGRTNLLYPMEKAALRDGVAEPHSAESFARGLFDLI